MAIIEIPISESFLPKELKASKLEIMVRHQNTTIQDIRVSFYSTALGWLFMQSERLFNYTEDICGPIFGGGFNPAKDYIITIGVKPEHVTVLSILYDGESLAEWLFGSSTAIDLSDPNNYLLYSVMQQITPKTQWGMSTTFHPAQQ